MLVDPPADFHPFPGRSKRHMFLRVRKIHQYCVLLFFITLFLIVFFLNDITSEDPIVSRTLPRVEENDECSETFVTSTSQIILPSFQKIQEIVIGPTHPVGSDAVCVFRRRKLHLHFPHAMQQLYACWSYWQQNKDKKPILLVQSESDGGIMDQIRYHLYMRRNQDNPFMKGVFESLRQLGIETSFDNKTVSVDEAVYPLDDPIVYRMLPGSNKRLRDKLVGISESCQRAPRIGILNRHATRSIENAYFIRSYLEQSLGTPVKIMYFEQVPFHQQIKWMSSVDILLSPHGAQLTSIPFMPNCGKVLEIFPDNYLDPILFGSLANASGLEHFYMYLGNSTVQHERVIAKMRQQDYKSKLQRSKSRSVNLCPSIKSMLDATQLMISRWQQCCDAQHTLA